MTLHLETRLCEHIPRLAWLARIDLTKREVIAYCGRDVETGDFWLVEGVWPGSFSDHDFAESEHFFGSGLVVEDNLVRLVPSIATVDRILVAEVDNVVHASNSLPLLLASTEARLDPNGSYDPSSYTVTKGIDQYDTRIPVSHRTLRHIHQYFHDAVIVSQHGIRTERRTRARKFRDFDEYVETLTTVLTGINENMQDCARRKPLDGFGTLSRGYDSPAVAVLTSSTGAQTYFTITESSTSIPKWLNRAAVEDDGRPIGAILGLSMQAIGKLRPKTVSQHELYFLAASTAAPETVFHSLAAELYSRDKPSVVYTGYHGDKIWERAPGEPYLCETLVRGDSSGLNLSEIRLVAGFINVAVPFIHARSAPVINKLSNSEEMVPWKLGTDYDRPIPRRIVEQAGVPRQMFGGRKRAVIDWYRAPHNKALRDSFLGWVDVNFGASPRRLLISNRLSRWAFIPCAIVDRLRGLFGYPEEQTNPRVLGADLQPEHWMFVWAANQIAESYVGFLSDRSGVNNEQQSSSDSTQGNVVGHSQMSADRNTIDETESA